MWTYANPVAIYAGAGSLGKLEELVGARRYGVVTYDSAYSRTLTQQVTDIIGRPPDLVINGVQEDPSLTHLAELHSQFQAAGLRPEIMIALGGGSVIDACKVLVACSDSSTKLWDIVLGRQSIKKVVDYIAVPTTAGTGSEVTCWATVWDPEGQRKYSLSDPLLYAEAAVLEPELTSSLPRSVTIHSALDALSHTFESLWNKNRNPVSRLYAVQAAKKILHSLSEVVEDKIDLDVRRGLQEGALLAGLAFSNTRTAIAHSLSYLVTLERSMPHGVACSFTLPVIIRACAEDDYFLRCVEDILGCSCWEAAALLEELLLDLGVKVHPADYGYGEADWMSVVDRAAEQERGKNYSGDIGELKACFQAQYRSVS
ncbi:iron-containing alcohol dehydrogenase [Parendozoicomonas haliclonae]|uniref:NAD-dependent methanol dehydrogenase n=1 Tax=Parendozoicomonas haliclonae TaxID=1960125 RepID=A0A1X7AGX8_9GAMM|nr:iron-containing alcohol dehydrogenase [Parendozoicomonas haliclonae]SMA41583.1 NAD-dependent methanol dehydrogenase [Parendozoicomonas haliclonae]